ncbi:c-type cytochrome [Methylobacterium crusticola]|uniref:c-type cytochrome n=1 Tax=Methylobacterium crusticola TaxID=1697972 RepID=UPI000FFC9C1B|nr:c-type cytochrome [Methylobacterium crusticola]
MILALLQPARAADPPEVAQPCLACHGGTLAEGAPPVAGHSNNYIQLQLVFFRSGRRQNEIMQGMAAGLSDNDIRALGRYFSSLPVPDTPPPPDAQPDLTRAGEGAAARLRCAACHGDAYQGVQAAPRIARLPEAYIAKALGDYRATRRPSSGGAAMTEVAGTLSDAEIGALAHYLAVLP